MIWKLHKLRPAIFISAGLFAIIIFYIYTTGSSYRYTYNRIKQQVGQPDIKQVYFQEVKELWPTELSLKLNYSAGEPLTLELITEMEKSIPSLPFEYFYRHSNKVMQKFRNCAQYPAIQVLNFYNTYWQTFYTGSSTYQLYGAYYDDRPATGPVVRVLAMTNQQRNQNPTLYCQLWYNDDNRPVLATVKEFKLIWDLNWGIQPEVYYPFMMTCEIPKNTNVMGDPIPKVVNLVARQCDTAKNSLRIIHNKLEYNEEKQDFAVCVKGLDFPYQDLSIRLVEWLELLNLLGVQKVFIHILQVHQSIWKVLNYYQRSQFVKVQNVSLVGGVVGQPKLNHWLVKGFKLNKRLNELITYNDCFYRNMYKYRFIALLDIDEIIMPKGNLTTWQQLLEKSRALAEPSQCPFAGLCATQVYFPSRLPGKQVPLNQTLKYVFMLNYAYRLTEYTVQHYHVKCLHNTEHVHTLHNHYPLSRLEASCPALDLPTDYVQLQHYRDLANNKEYKGINNTIIRDGNLERFRLPLTRRCANVLTELGFLIKKEKKFK